MAALEDALAGPNAFSLQTFYRNAGRNASSFTSGNQGAALWFYENPNGVVFLVISEAPYVIQRIQRAFGVTPVDGRFGPQTLAAIRADAARAGIQFQNAVDHQLMAYALRKAFHSGVGRVAVPSRVELPNPDNAVLASGSSTYINALNIRTGQSAPIDSLPTAPPAAAAQQPAPSTAIIPSPSTGTPSVTVVRPNTSVGTPSLTGQPASGGGVVVSNAGMFGDLFSANMTSMFGGTPASPCPPCNTVGPNGQCKPMDPRDCNPAAAQAIASVGAAGALKNLAIVAGVFIAAGTGAVAIAGANRSAAQQRAAAAKEAKGEAV